MKTNIILTLIVLGITKTFAQTGPGGIGSSSNIIFWLSAGVNTSTTTDNTELDYWNDCHGNMEVKKKGQKPKFRNTASKAMNGYPVISFDGEGDELTMNNDKRINTDKNGYNERTFSLVLRTSNEITAKQLIFEEGGKSNGFAIYIANNKLYATAFKNGNYQVTCSDDVATNTAYIVTVIFNTNTDEFSLYLNGGLSQLVNGISTMPAHTGGIGIGRINGRIVFHDNAVGTGEFENDNGRDFKGDLAEFIMYDAALTEVERIIKENYAGAKFNIALNANIAKNNMSSPVDGDFDHDVIGLGKASDGSGHTDSQGSGIIRINNPNDLENDEYLLIGHSNGMLGSYGINDLPNGIEARIQRIWKAAETGDVGNIDIVFDLSSFGNIDANDLRLLIDTDDDGYFADEIEAFKAARATSGIFSGASNMGSGLYKFSSVNINNGQSFTVGSANSFSTALPVNLVKFDAKIIGEMVNITWVTATEMNNDFFTVERSNDTNNWEMVTIVEGAGTTVKLNNYSVTDSKLNEGTVYYRLKQTDFDGTITISKIVAVNTSVNLDNVKITYNKTAREIQINGLSLNKVESVKVNIFSLNGQLVKHINLGNNNGEIAFGASEFSGLFLVSLTYNHELITQKIQF